MAVTEEKQEFDSEGDQTSFGLALRRSKPLSDEPHTSSNTRRFLKCFYSALSYYYSIYSCWRSRAR